MCCEFYFNSHSERSEESPKFPMKILPHPDKSGFLRMTVKRNIKNPQLI